MATATLQNPCVFEGRRRHNLFLIGIRVPLVILYGWASGLWDLGQDILCDGWANGVRTGWVGYRGQGRVDGL